MEPVTRVISHRVFTNEWCVRVERSIPDVVNAGSVVFGPDTIFACLEAQRTIEPALRGAEREVNHLVELILGVELTFGRWSNDA